MLFRSSILPLPNALAARAMFGAFAGLMNPPGRPAEAFRAYRVAMPGASGQAVRERVMTDCLFRKPSVEFAAAMAAAAPGRVFLYRYDWPSPALGGAFGAMHGLDLLYLWNMRGRVRSDRPIVRLTGCSVICRWRYCHRPREGGQR